MPGMKERLRNDSRKILCQQRFPVLQVFWHFHLTSDQATAEHQLEIFPPNLQQDISLKTFRVWNIISASGVCMKIDLGSLKIFLDKK